MTGQALRRMPLLAGLVLALTGAAQAEQLYRCEAYSGGKFWSREHCQQHGALVDRIANVPSGLSLERQIRLAEQGAREAEGGSRRSVIAATSRSEQEAVRRQLRAAERQRARCTRLRDGLEHQYSRSRQPLTARQQAGIAAKQQQLRSELDRAGC